ncbi:MAG TPA: sigma-54 dependent transcriptional regulator [Syntrophales bacterium]|nr:sigma-54 dependent transcriptional regulator [Syntrophales bacterium]HOU78531.1 sigma-54 dependent transcriptional regulator [Syntrophales bacterium]HQG34658.1 sigma-54 dependent transcriptional regulator [Syntrophales bacterium]HQI36728.1 sigma-54 dependent transcriptional regulator [Syntrophales bacterium]HQJ31016.1 sigma-54 dependent transcriptional regulator [Syntrophales bacterium]
MKILIVDDEEIALTSVQRLLKWRGLRNVEICDNGREAIRLIRRKDYDIVLLDLLMPETDGMQVLEATKPSKPWTEFIILTAVDDIPATVRAIRMGAYDYLVKPVDNELLFLTIERAYERKGLLKGLSAGSRTEDVPRAFAEIITQCPLMKSLLAYAQVMARSGNPVLITGESGTGKELMARGIHRAGPSPEGPFIAVNVSAIPSTMFETQFFGHVRGAFTGAEANYRGFFEQADGGTLFLDEIGELPPGLQAKLLRVLEEKSFTPLGGAKTVEVDVRVISATNMDLEKACQEGRFRLDLLYRLQSAHVHIPPLREREGDIALLAGHFLREASGRHGKEITSFSPEAMDVLNRREYRGNVRELHQVVENAVLLCEGGIILPHHLGRQPTRQSLFARRLCSLKENDETQVAYVLMNTGGDRRQTAEILGITVRQLQRKLAQMREDPYWREVMGDALSRDKGEGNGDGRLVT